ncbi:hypothetical protein HUN07_11735 [Rhodococcus sp. W8901]|nr:hypothetical protein HUN07_11735 [Rhodococcus sp. W8901]
MSDLNDTPSPVYLVVVEEAERLLDDDSDELSTFLKVCSAIGRYWSSRIGLGSLWGGGEVAFNTLILFSRPSGPVLDTIRSDHEILTLRDG